MVTVLTCFSSASLFFKSVLDGVVENRLGFCGILAFLVVDEPRLFLAFARFNRGLHGFKSGISFRP